MSCGYYKIMSNITVNLVQRLGTPMYYDSVSLCEDSTRKYYQLFRVTAFDK